MAQKQPLADIEDFHSDQKHRSHCLRNCSLGCLGVLLLVGGGLAFLVARSGLAVIPGFSQLAYRSPEPRALVTTTDDQVKLLGERLLSQAEAQQATGEAMTVTLSEAELTALARQKTPEATITLRDGTLEWYTPYGLEKFTVYLTVEAVPKIEGDRLHADITRVKIGQLGVPTFLLNAVGRMIQTSLIDTNEFIKQITFNEVIIADETLTVTGQLPTNIGQNLGGEHE
ncbi:hypothetical protein HY523_00865 [Candidatus Berkelbacteria bacterium]|nr:hypothetical protein [Candidatus Berkelbacteria bacterium]